MSHATLSDNVTFNEATPKAVRPTLLPDRGIHNLPKNAEPTPCGWSQVDRHRFMVLAHVVP